MKKLFVVLSLMLSLAIGKNAYAADTTPPPALTGVQTYMPTYYQGELDLKWRSCLVYDTYGYNVYLNGVKQKYIGYSSNKLGTTVLKDSYYTRYTEYNLYKLPIGKYIISVTVVDTSGNESLPFTTTVWMRY